MPHVCDSTHNLRMGKQWTAPLRPSSTVVLSLGDKPLCDQGHPMFRALKKVPNCLAICVP